MTTIVTGFIILVAILAVVAVGVYAFKAIKASTGGEKDKDKDSSGSSGGSSSKDKDKGFIDKVIDELEDALF